MQKIDVGQTITILANIGVIAGIVFLGVELRQNNTLLTAQARSDRSEVRRQAISRYLENPDLVRITIKAQKGEALSAEEQYVLDSANQATLVDLQYVYGEYRRGLLEEDALPIELWRRNIGSRPGLREYWSSNTQYLEPDFVEWMQENIVN